MNEKKVVDSSHYYYGEHKIVYIEKAVSGPRDLFCGSESPASHVKTDLKTLSHGARGELQTILCSPY